MGDIPLCWCGKPSRDPERYDWCGKCKTPSDPEIASAWQNRRELVEQRDSYKAKAEELELSLNIATDGRNHWWERQVGEITDRLMTIVDDEIDPMPTAGPHESMDRIVAGLRAFRAEAEEWQARAEALAGVLREIAKPVDCPADEVALWDELSAKAALNAYDAAKTSKGGDADAPAGTPADSGSTREATPPPSRVGGGGSTTRVEAWRIQWCSCGARPGEPCRGNPIGGHSRSDKACDECGALCCAPGEALCYACREHTKEPVRPFPAGAGIAHAVKRDVAEALRASTEGREHTEWAKALIAAAGRLG